ncbi:MAG: hypothetical protein R3D66_02940 [Alphaproteobacteria bacterium]
MIWISIILALTVPSVIWVGYLNRNPDNGGTPKGIGWQFIRYTVLSISIPVIGLLALNNVLTGEAAALIGSAMGYAFGKKEMNNPAPRGEVSNSLSPTGRGLG